MTALSKENKDLILKVEKKNTISGKIQRLCEDFAEAVKYYPRDSQMTKDLAGYQKIICEAGLLWIEKEDTAARTALHQVQDELRNKASAFAAVAEKKFLGKFSAEGVFAKKYKEFSGRVKGIRSDMLSI